MKQQLKYAIYLCGFTLCVMGFLHQHPFFSEVSQTIPATVYMGDGSVVHDVEPIPVDTLWQDILLGKSTFYDPISQESVDIHSLEKVLLTDDFTVEQFTKVDLDGDGIQELLLRINQDQGAHTSILIFHRQGDSATIYATPERWMYDIKTDGSYQYSLGGLDYGITTQLSFQGESYVASQGIYSLGMDGTSAIYAVGDDTPLTEENLQQAYAQQDEKEAVDWYDVEDATATDYHTHGTTLYYDGTAYPLTQQHPSINAIKDCVLVGEYLVIEGHIGPKNAVYCLFNTQAKTFAPPIFGASLIWHSDDITTAVYAFWNEVYAYDGALLATYSLGESEYIDNLAYADDGTQIEVMISSATADSYMEYIDFRR